MMMVPGIRLVSLIFLPFWVTSFTLTHHPQQRQQRHCRRRVHYPLATRLLDTTNANNGQVGSGPNWLERSFPVDTKEGISIDPKAVDDYNLGLSGTSWQVGPLSLRMYDTMTERSTALEQASDPDTTLEILRALKLYALDFTAKEACKAALLQNGLQMVLSPNEEDAGMWGDVDSIRLLDEATGEALPQIYEDWEHVVDQWIPGQGFDFVVRQVPAKMRELTVDEVLGALRIPDSDEGEDDASDEAEE